MVSYIFLLCNRTKKILGTFNSIFSLNINDLDFGDEYVSPDVFPITTDNDITCKFPID